MTPLGTGLTLEDLHDLNRRTVGDRWDLFLVTHVGPSDPFPGAFHCWADDFEAVSEYVAENPSKLLFHCVEVGDD